MQMDKKWLNARIDTRTKWKIRNECDMFFLELDWIELKWTERLTYASLFLIKKNIITS